MAEKISVAFSIVNAENGVEEMSIVNLPTCDISMMIDYTSVAQIRRNLVKMLGVCLEIIHQFDV
jgi:hypothetical protein